MKAIFLAPVLLVLFIAQDALAIHHYYPRDNHKALRGLTSHRDNDLKYIIKRILTSNHQKHADGSHDTLDCSRNVQGSCYRHKALDYYEARVHLFGALHLEEDSNGHYIKDVYCRKVFRSNVGVGENKVPNHNKINCEHTWPQSRFSNSYPHHMQKGDLHHLFPTDNKANNTRGSFQFTNANGNSLPNCAPSYNNRDGRFEPPMEHQGNVARALFYFAVRYNLKISRAEEAVLKEWHIQDPVDAEEMDRNDAIFKIQGNRNPFIDFPELVEKISDF